MSAPRPLLRFSAALALVVGVAVAGLPMAQPVRESLRELGQDLGANATLQQALGAAVLLLLLLVLRLATRRKPLPRVLVPVPVAAGVEPALASQGQTINAAPVVPRPYRKLIDEDDAWAYRRSHPVPKVRLAVLRGLPGLDLSTALSQMARPQLLQSLQLFSVHFSPLPLQIQQAWFSNDRQVAVLGATILKLQAGRLGMAEIQAVAAALERKLETPADAPPQADLDRLQGLLDTMCAQLAQHLPLARMPAGYAKDKTPRLVNPQARPDELKALAQMMQARNRAALNLFRQHAPGFASTFGAEGAAAIQRQLEEFDFDSALAELRNRTP